MRYCGRNFPPEEMALIRRLIADDPSRTRAQLSRLWNESIHRYHYLGYKTLPGAQLRVSSPPLTRPSLCPQH